MTFPEHFLWGTATAAHQVEGGNVNNEYWVLEHVPDTIFMEPSGDACDHYHHYQEDIALLEQLGFNLYRFSLEWSRIEPEEGEFSHAALEHYRRMLAACHEHGLTPMVTFHHFTSPRWLIASGGWNEATTPEKFARYCEYTTRYLGDLIGAACTINEPNIGPLIFSMGMLPPIEQLRQMTWWKAAAKTLGVTSRKFNPLLFTLSPQGRKTIIAAHHRAVQAIKSERGDFPVGITLALQDIQSVEGGEAYADKVNTEVNDAYLQELRNDDFVGVQTYTRCCFGPDGLVPPAPQSELTQMGYEFWPEALEATIRQAHDVAGIPVFVTENGLATSDDTRRIEYITRALQGVANCLKDGIDVRGYTYWSAFDNFEWMLGYQPKFGLIGVDRATQTRTVKPSARWLGEVAQKNEW